MLCKILKKAFFWCEGQISCGPFCSLSKAKDLTLHIQPHCNDNTRLQRNTSNANTSGSFREIWYSLYNGQIFWLCEIAEALLRSVGEPERNQADQLEPRRLLPQYAGMLLKAHQRDVSDIPLCDPQIYYVAQRRDKLALDLLSALFRSIGSNSAHHRPNKHFETLSHEVCETRRNDTIIPTTWVWKQYKIPLLY